MIAAADDLATGLSQAVLQVRHALTDLEAHLTFGERPTGEGDLIEARRLIDEAIARLARVELLFGLTSPTAVAANTAVVSLRDAVDSLHSSAPDPTATLDTGWESFGKAAVAYREFSGAAREATTSFGRL
jgi:hypothetical protein